MHFLHHQTGAGHRDEDQDGDDSPEEHGDNDDGVDNNDYADNDKADEVDQTDANISARCATYGTKAESDTWGPANPAPPYTPGHPGQKPMMIDIALS